jgi:hypothetical protein
MGDGAAAAGNRNIWWSQQVCVDRIFKVLVPLRIYVSSFERPLKYWGASSATQHGCCAEHGAEPVPSHAAAAHNVT